jgi:hypothetical protein
MANNLNALGYKTCYNVFKGIETERINGVKPLTILRGTITLDNAQAGNAVSVKVKGSATAPLKIPAFFNVVNTTLIPLETPVESGDGAITLNIGVAGDDNAFHTIVDCTGYDKDLPYQIRGNGDSAFGFSPEVDTTVQFIATPDTANIGAGIFEIQFICETDVPHIF